MNIPDDVKKQIEKLYVLPLMRDYKHIVDFDIATSATKELRFAASFGYSLSQSKISELEKEIVELRMNVGRSGEDYLLEIDRKNKHIQMLKKEWDGNKEQAAYWKSRCEAAEEMYRLLNNGENHTKEYATWQSLKSKHP